MGKPPAFIFIVRHGNRLDAADKQWHLTSPEPYNPPLTFGGWQQAKALGARIGSILRDKILEEEVAAREDPTRKRKRYKIVLHSSPFLRCIQTSIAISAGVAQDSTPLAVSNTSAAPPPTITNSNSDAPVRPSVATDLRKAENAAGALKKIGPTRKCVLRLDACLGEWLTPGYYEHITPPPESVMMLASAKADLLRREDYSSYPNFPTGNQSSSLWGASAKSPASASAPDGLENMTSVAGALPRSDSTSAGSQGPQAGSGQGTGYTGPVPNYAISSSSPIPMGYVAHARDACAEIDFQWDSMRGPLNWGDGGTYGEEWTAMHRRFRKGIQALVNWYISQDSPTDMVTRSWKAKSSAESNNLAEEDDDVETEAIVILVSHGAGCNALIGAVTHEPVLMDVAMASLTMAVRKKPTASAEVGNDNATADSEANTTPASPRLGNGKEEATPVHQLYDLKLFANTEHLRPSTASSTPTSTRSPSVSNVRGRHSNSSSSSTYNFSFSNDAGNRSSPATAVLGGLNVRRESNSSPRSAFGVVNGGAGITVGSGMTSFLTNSSFTSQPSGLSRTPSIGLWSPITRQDGEDEEEEDMVLNFSHEKVESSPKAKHTPDMGSRPASNFSSPETGTSTTASVRTPPDAKSDPMLSLKIQTTSFALIGSEPSDAPAFSPLGLGIGAGGLWGSGNGERTPDVLYASKRRWTVNERA